MINKSRLFEMAAVAALMGAPTGPEIAPRRAEKRHIMGKKWFKQRKRRLAATNSSRKINRK